MKALFVSLTTYTSPHNRGILEAVAERIDAVEVVAADTPSMWSERGAPGLVGGIPVRLVRPRFAGSWTTATLPQLDRVFELLRPDVIHVEGEPWQATTVQTILGGRRVGIPVGIQFAENGPLFRTFAGHARRAIGRWALREAAYAIGWSRAATAFARTLAPQTPAATMPATGTPTIGPANCDPSVWFGRLGGEERAVAFVGRLAAEKGVLDALDAMDRVQADLPLRVALAGAGPLEPEVRSWAERREWAHFHSVLPRHLAAELLAAADAVLMPSRRTRTWAEQFGKVAVETMALGTPVIGYASGALPEVVGAGGILVREGDLDALAEALRCTLGATPDVRRKLSNAARRQAAPFSDAALADRLITLWGSVLRTATA